MASLAALLMSVLVLTGCGDVTVREQPRDFVSPQQAPPLYQGRSAIGDTPAGETFARWVLDQDPGREYMTEAVVRNEDSLGVKVQPNVRKQDVHQLLVSLTEGMARTFRGKPLTVIAFYQSGDKLAQSNYDPRSGEITVNFFQ